MVDWNSVTFFGCLTIAVLVGFVTEESHQTTGFDETALLRALGDHAEVHNGEDSKTYNVAVGCNANLDLVAGAIDVFKLMGLEPSSTSLDHSQVLSDTSLIETFQYHFGRGSAAERFVVEDTLFRSLVAAAEKVDDAKFSVGGNAALIGTQLVELGADVMLGGKVGSTLRQLIPSDMKVGSELLGHGVAAEDEVHLILEFSKDSEFGGVVCPRSNRLILVRDLTNSRVAALEEFGRAIQASSQPPDMLVLSGFHLLDAESEDVRLERLVVAQRLLSDLPSKTMVHVEWASTLHSGLTAAVAAKLFSRVDSVGMNEQELSFLYHTLGGSERLAPAAALSANQPEPQLISWALRHVLRRIHELRSEQQHGDLPQHDQDGNKLPDEGGGSRERGADRGLSRVHFHSFSYHIIADVVASPAAAAASIGQSQPVGDVEVDITSLGGIWKLQGQAAAAGSVMATLKACAAAELSELSNDDLEISFPASFTLQAPDSSVAEVFTATPSSPVVSWTWPLTSGVGRDSRMVVYRLAPVVGCKSPKSTVGLGDAISAAGIFTQRHRNRSVKGRRSMGDGTRAT